MLRLLIFCMVFAVITVVALGAYTRLVDAGLGCPDWPTCYGHLWVPDSVEEIHTANQNFTDTPVETDKTWPEQIHRIFASSLGILILWAFFIVNRRLAKVNLLPQWNSVSFLLLSVVALTILRIAFGHIMEWPLALAILAYFANLVRFSRGITEEHRRTFIMVAMLAGLIVMQGLFGMWTVTLKLWPQVVTAHLLGGFAVLTLICLLCLDTYLPERIKLTLPSKFKRVSGVVLLLLIGQIALGGWTSSNYAALACPDLPTCQNSWLPDMDMRSGFNVMQHVGPNYLGGQLDNTARVAIHFTHRVGAVIVSAALVYLIYLLFRYGYRKYALLIAVALVLQVTLGLSNVLLALPLSVAVLHNAGGALLLVLLAWLHWRSWLANTVLAEISSSHT